MLRQCHNGCASEETPSKPSDTSCITQQNHRRYSFHLHSFNQSNDDLSHSLTTVTAPETRHFLLRLLLVSHVHKSTPDFSAVVASKPGNLGGEAGLARPVNSCLKGLCSKMHLEEGSDDDSTSLLLSPIIPAQEYLLRTLSTTIASRDFGSAGASKQHQSR